MNNIKNALILLFFISLNLYSILPDIMVFHEFRHLRRQHLQETIFKFARENVVDDFLDNIDTNKLIKSDEEKTKKEILDLTVNHLKSYNCYNSLSEHNLKLLIVYAELKIINIVNSLFNEPGSN